MGSLHLSPRFFKQVIPVLSLLGLAAGRCFAPQTPPEPDPKLRSALAETFLQQRLPFWQNRLHLQDWKVSIHSVPTAELRPHTLGNIHWDKDTKTGVIRVLDAADYRMSYEATLKDMEFTIVHELIHLELASLPRSEASRSDEEHAINRLATAILKAEHDDNDLVPASHQ